MMHFSFKFPMDSNHIAMHTPKQTSAFVRVLIQLLAVTTVSATAIIISLPATAQTPAPASKTKTETTTTTAKAEPLSGAELWTMNCSRCHMARNPGEFTAAQWRTIIRHMRVRANLPAYQVKELQKYLEGGAGK